MKKLVFILALALITIPFSNANANPKVPSNQYHSNSFIFITNNPFIDIILAMYFDKMFGESGIYPVQKSNEGGSLTAPAHRTPNHL